MQWISLHPNLYNHSWSLNILIQYALYVSQECPVGTYKDAEGSDPSLCKPCPLERLPTRAKFVYVRGIATVMLHLFHRLVSICLDLLLFACANLLQVELPSQIVLINASLTNIGRQSATHLLRSCYIHLEDPGPLPLCCSVLSCS